MIEVGHATDDAERVLMFASNPSPLRRGSKGSPSVSNGTLSVFGLNSPLSSHSIPIRDLCIEIAEDQSLILRTHLN